MLRSRGPRGRLKGPVSSPGNTGAGLRRAWPGSLPHGSGTHKGCPYRYAALGRSVQELGRLYTPSDSSAGPNWPALIILCPTTYLYLMTMSCAWLAVV